MPTVEARVALYDEAVTSIADYEESSEVRNAFVNREAITDALDRGEERTPMQREVLSTADAALLAVRPLLAERFPRIFAARDDIPAAYWWWHLHRKP